VSIPFFFEPNFDALIEPLDINIQHDQENREPLENGSLVMRKSYAPVVYGEFLMKKVGSNFAGGPKKRY